MIVPAITLRILPPTAPVNHRFTAAARNSQFYELVTFGVTWTLTNAGGRALTAQLRGDINRRPQPRRCEAAAAAGFSGIGLHSGDLSRTIAAGVDVPEMRAVLRNNGLALVEIEFLAAGPSVPTRAGESRHL
jgi:hypothetical protein